MMVERYFFTTVIRLIDKIDNLKIIDEVKAA